MAGAVFIDVVFANAIPVTAPPPYVAPPSNPPTISIKPMANVNKGGTEVTLDVTVTIPAEAKTQIESVGYNLDGSNNSLYSLYISPPAGTSQSIHISRTLTGLLEGEHSIAVYASCVSYTEYTRDWAYHANGYKQPMGSATAYSAAVWGSSGEIQFVVDAVPLRVTVLSLENETYKSGDVPLSFVVSEATSWIGYGLDDEATQTVNGNTTLTGLSDGTHTITVYATDTAGATGKSQPVTFNIKTQQTEPQPSEPFPTTWIAAAVLIVVVVGAGLAVYFRKSKR